MSQKFKVGFWCIDAWNARYSKHHAFRKWHAAYPYPQTVCGTWPRPQFGEKMVPCKKSDLTCGKCRRILKIRD